tara:strand:- start:72 stop:890 length:819 start_codon:yes stop_codon:yes gene_type:complete
MMLAKKSLIIGRGSGISKYLSEEFRFDNVPSSQIKNINLSKYENIIYTSADPSFELPKDKISLYLEKNIINIHRIIESDFKGSFTYLSSIDSGPYAVSRNQLNHQIENMFTPYSFSKYCCELMLRSNKKFNSCNILRIGLLLPAKKHSNFYKALNSSPEDIQINFNSSFYLTPYSLILKFIKNNFEKDNNVFGYLTSSNKIFLSDILRVRNLIYSSEINSKNKYLYRSREKDTNLDNILKNNFYNWKEENDFDPLIAKCLQLYGNEDILPNL